MDPLTLILIIVIFLFSVVIHEVAHGTMANILGDPTAKYAGRLTLNPLKHLDLFGSIIVPGILILTSMAVGGGIIFGWAKPVPINPYNFRDQKYGSAKTALAGPAANILLALVFGLLIRFLPFGTGLFSQNLIFVFGFIVWVNLLLAIFNLLPIPPLDGSHILFAFLPQSMEKLKMILAQYGLFILLFVIFFLLHWIIPAINYLFYLIVGVPFF
ncbi:site-2 protease family protein [Candidatus Parcubacteria bacterium]|nr:site-2 protease family protein [Candidatus Parcubacteria bacterium]